MTGCATSNRVARIGCIDFPRITIGSVIGLVTCCVLACGSLADPEQVPTGTVIQGLNYGCADLTAEQIFSPAMVGCAEIVTFANRATLCGVGYRVATALEWQQERNGIAPTHDYWTDDTLKYNGNGSSCFVSTTVGNSCGTTPMRVCTASGTDPEGNQCNWQHCGLDTNSPDEFFGGCVDNTTAGALCIYDPGMWNFIAVCGPGNCDPDPPDPRGDPDYLQVAILDNDPAGAHVNINVSPSGLELRRVTVDVNITHSFVGDLVIQVIAPNGQIATLSNRQGGSGDNFVANGLDITSSFTSQSDVSGTWQLFVRDLAAADVGTINSFGLHISTAD